MHEAGFLLLHQGVTTIAPCVLWEQRKARLYGCKQAQSCTGYRTFITKSQTICDMNHTFFLKKELSFMLCAFLFYFYFLSQQLLPVSTEILDRFPDKDFPPHSRALTEIRSFIPSFE